MTTATRTVKHTMTKKQEAEWVKKAAAGQLFPKAEVKHGTLSGYTNYRCRCDDCRAAMSTYWRAYRIANADRLRAQGRIDQQVKRARQRALANK